MASSDPQYAERLWPAWWVWFVAATIAAATSLIVAPVSATVATILPFVVAALFLWWLVTLATPITVTETELVVGRAHVEREYIAGAEALTGHAAFLARGIELDARAYLMIRGWVPDVVKITIDDDSDPTPYWLISSREAAKFARTLG